MLLTVLVIFLVLALVGGGIGHANFGYAGWSPAAIILIILVILFATGRVAL